MSDILLGILGVVLALLFLSAGFLFGWKMNDQLRQHTSKAVDRQLSEDEKRRAELRRRRMEEEEEAFSALMGYNAATAYGMNKGVEELISKG